MKTPEEIKKGLECCIKACDCDNNCPYMPEINCTLAQRQDALAYIQQLEKINADFAERTARLEAQVPKWVSVREKLPENSGKYLAFTHGGNIEAFHYSVKHRAFNAFDSLPDSANSIRVRYWMPLPEAPKEG